MLEKRSDENSFSFYLVKIVLQFNSTTFCFFWTPRFGYKRTVKLLVSASSTIDIEIECDCAFDGAF